MCPIPQAKRLFLSVFIPAILKQRSKSKKSEIKYNEQREKHNGVNKSKRKEAALTGNDCVVRDQVNDEGYGESSESV